MNLAGINQYILYYYYMLSMHFKNGEVYTKESNGNKTYVLTSLIIRESKPKIIIIFEGVSQICVIII